LAIGVKGERAGTACAAAASERGARSARPPSDRLLGARVVSAALILRPFGVAGRTELRAIQTICRHAFCVIRRRVQQAMAEDVKIVVDTTLPGL
jgi:hypothetical protein